MVQEEVEQRGSGTCWHACVQMQVAPVVDASSSQSRTDVLVILLSAVLLLTGLQWLALQPKVKPSVSCIACPGIFDSRLVLLQLLLALVCRSLLELALQVQLEGTDPGFMEPGLPKDTQQELQWWVISPPPMQHFWGDALHGNHASEQPVV